MAGSAESSCRYDEHFFKTFSDTPLVNHFIYDVYVLNDTKAKNDAYINWKATYMIGNAFLRKNKKGKKTHWHGANHFAYVINLQKKEL